MFGCYSALFIYKTKLLDGSLQHQLTINLGMAVEVKVEVMSSGSGWGGSLWNI